jgi:hypothetical protein
VEDVGGQVLQDALHRPADRDRKSVV